MKTANRPRDFSFVEDIARANLLAVTSERIGRKAVNVGSGRGVSIRRVAELVSEAFRFPVQRSQRKISTGEIRHLISIRN